MNQFTSVFKINGRHILPPVITDAYREELRMLKQKAIEVERTLQKRNPTYLETEAEEPIDETESEYMKISSMNDNALSGSSPRRRLFSQQKPIEQPPDTPPLLQLSSATMDEPISLELSDAPQKLVRSNSLTSNSSNKSYIIDTPSPLLIKQMQSQGINIRKSISLPNSATKNLFRKVSPKREIKKAKTTVQKYNTRVVAKMTKSPYEPNCKPRKCPKTVKNQDNNESKKATRTTKVQPAPKCESVLETYQSEYNAKLKALLAKQELEQLRMKQDFERQQNELIKLMGQASIQRPKCISTIFTSTPLQSEAQSTTDSETTQNISSQLSNFDVDDVTVNESFTYDDFYSCVNKTLENTAHHEKSKRSPDLQVENASTSFERRQRAAATTITAYTKGYLCRRLIKTERVQTIIQTIRDTLLFILDLHSETSRNSVDIQLKGMLLQQLVSSCDSLHNIFSGISARERMEVIANDRNMLRRKFSKHQTKSTFRLHQQLEQPRNLQVCSLFSVNINSDVNSSPTVQCLTTVQQQPQMRSQVNN